VSLWLAGRRLTLGVAAVAMAVAASASLPAALELREAPTTGAEPWRLLTGHLVHLNGRQLIMNLIAFVWLGCLCEPKMPRRYGMLLIASALAVGAGVLHLHPNLASYRGLSGIASAQFSALVVLRWREARRSGRAALALPPLLAFVLFLGKTVFEIETGRALFAGSLALGGAGPSPAAHLFGALAGLVVVLLPAPDSRTPAPAPETASGRAANGPAPRGQATRGAAGRVG